MNPFTHLSRLFTNFTLRFMLRFVPWLFIGLLLIGVAIVLAQTPYAQAAMQQAARQQETISAAAVPTIPKTTNYQGVVKDANGNPLNGSYNMILRIYSSETSAISTKLWEEFYANVPVREGRFTVLLGGQTPLGTVLDNSPRYVGITVQGVNGDAEMTPRQEIRAVPWARYVSYATYVDAAEIADVATSATLANRADTTNSVVALYAPARHIYTTNAWGSGSATQVEITAHKNNPSGTMCMLTAVRVEVPNVRPNCVFNASNSVLTAQRRNLCEMTCFTFKPLP